MNLREIADEAIAEVEDSCEVGIEECRSKFGPGKCRFHCTRYLDLIRDSVSCEEAKASLQKAGIKVTSLDDSMKEDCDLAARMFCKRLGEGIKPIGRIEYEKTVRSLYAVVKDLKERFPKYEIPKFIFVPAETHNGAVATVDAILYDEAVIVANSCHDFSGWNGFSFGHSDERIKYDVLRHEIGHADMDACVSSAWIKMLNDYLEYAGKNRLLEELMKVSKYSACVSSEKDTSYMYESFAEAFAKITSIDYEYGSLPDWIEDFVLSKLEGV